MLPCYIPCVVKHLCQKTSINDKLQGNVATYLRGAGVVDNQIKKDLSVAKFLKSVNRPMWQSYKQEGGCLVHVLRLLAVWW